MGHKKVTALRWLMVSCPPYWIKDGGHLKKGYGQPKFYADQDSYRKKGSQMYMKRVTSHFT